jgi:hypothetical protein
MTSLRHSRGQCDASWCLTEHPHPSVRERRATYMIRLSTKRTPFAIDTRCAKPWLLNSTGQVTKANGDFEAHRNTMKSTTRVGTRARFRLILLNDDGPIS